MSRLYAALELRTSLLDNKIINFSLMARGYVSLIASKVYIALKLCIGFIRRRFGSLRVLPSRILQQVLNSQVSEGKFDCEKENYGINFYSVAYR